MKLKVAGFLLGALFLAPVTAFSNITIGSKKFTESVILAEIATKLIGEGAVHKPELGGTQIVWKALLRGDIDIYPEYTGTIAKELVQNLPDDKEESLRKALSALGVGMTEPLGFSNTYALGIPKDVAEQFHIKKISDLKKHPELRLGLSHEFLDRADGWPQVKSRYQLNPKSVTGLDHDLAYRAIQSGEIQITDLYSTDAEIRYYDLEVLEDDLGIFPAYRAVFLYRLELEKRSPQSVAALKRLERKITRSLMVDMNAKAKIDKQKEAQVAAEFLKTQLQVRAAWKEIFFGEQLLLETKRHLYLVFVSLFAAIAVAVPLGVFAARHIRLGEIILGLAGIVQTIPSLALLVFMIPLLGIGAAPALFALFLYGLLPILRNTYLGLRGIAPALIESADALGLSHSAKLWKVELPLASPSILAGIKTAAVINVGTATLGALIGAGGYGEPILIGIRRDDLGMILQGAIPAALLALLIQGLFELTERRLIPKGLRLK